MSMKPTQSGSAVLVVLILLVLAAGAGMWFYLKKDASGSIDAITGNIETPTDVTSTPDQSSLGETPIAPAESTPADLTAPAVPTDAGNFVTDSAGVAAVDVEKVMGVRGIGNPDAPIKIVEYASMTCSHCAHFHNDILPELKSKYIDTGKVYLQFVEFPLNDPALKATITARCLPEARYDGFVSLLFKNQEQWSTGIDYMAHLKQNAKLAGLSDEQFQACHDNGEIKTRIAASMQEAQDKWKVSSTPTFIINEGAQTISGAQPLENFERAFREITNGAVGEAPAVE